MLVKPDGPVRVQARKIKSAERTLALFELFSREQRPFTVTMIAQVLNIPQPSVSMLLQNLDALGYLEYDRRARTYTPSIRVALLGSWINMRFNRAGSIGARLDVLQRTVRETAFLGIQNGAAAQYVVIQLPDAANRLHIESGQFRSLTCSAMGRALLSLKPDHEVLALARRSNAEATDERFIVRERDIMEIIMSVRATGYAITEGDVTPGLAAVAVTVSSPMTGAPMAVGVGGPISRMRRKRDSALEALAHFKAGMIDHEFGLPTD